MKFFEKEFVKARYSHLSPSKKLVQKAIDFDDFESMCTVAEKKEILGLIKREVETWAKSRSKAGANKIEQYLSGIA